MANPIMNEEYPDNDRRAGVCYAQWENRDKGTNMEIIRKSFTGIELKKDKPGFFTARIATLNVIDKDGDVTLNGAFPDGKQILISAYEHGSWSGALPVGKGFVHEIGNEALVDGEFNLNIESGKEHYEAIKFAPQLIEWSYGFKILALDEDNANWRDNPKVYRVLKSLDVFEASPVLRGAGVDTATLAIKSDNGKTFTDEAEAVLAAANALVTRAKSLADLRQEEGRTLSKANRDRLDKLSQKLAGISQEIKTILMTGDNGEEGRKALMQLFKTKTLLEVNF